MGAAGAQPPDQVLARPPLPAQSDVGPLESEYRIGVRHPLVRGLAHATSRPAATELTIRVLPELRDPIRVRAPNARRRTTPGAAGARAPNDAHWRIGTLSGEYNQRHRRQVQPGVSAR